MTNFPDPDPPEARKRRGAVYTPRALADWVAELVLARCPDAPEILDLGCGEGALIEGVLRVAPEARCAGVEMNSIAVARARRSLGSHARFHTEDVLQPASLRASRLADHWRAALGGAPTAVVMNPPWGAVHTASRELSVSRGLSLAIGQYDTYDLFCELALQVVRDGGAYGFILPDSLFLPEHQPLRELMLHRTSISLIARLGEGIFPGVYRGCVVVVGVVEPSSPDHRIECLRITKEHRDALQSSERFEACRTRLAHSVPQARFAEDPWSRFDIDVTEADETIAKILAIGSGWTAPLVSRRGAEISKSGRILQCGHCHSARPAPKHQDAYCLACGMGLADIPVTRIIEDAPGRIGKWAPFVAGEDVRRYTVRPSRWIRTGVRGINYKAPPAPGRDRLLVRKTGVGLNAAIDATGAYTNQVVFDYVLKTGHRFDFSYLHYVLGVLSSRILFAFHLKRGGDLEWRSHPYVTQKTLADLPIPEPKRGSRQWTQAAAIAKAVQANQAQGGRELEIEALVAGLYGLAASDIRWALDVLDEAADLEPMRLLRLPKSVDILPVVVT